MIFYPSCYESLNIGRYNTIVVFGYDKNNEKVCIKIRYPYSFYVSSMERGDIEEILSSLVGISITDNYIETRSTRRPLDKVSAVRIDCDNVQIRSDAVRLLQGRSAMIHEINMMLNPLLKLIEERDVQYYCWMEIDVEEDNDKISNYDNYREYRGDYHSLRKCEELVIPPPFSIFSFDLECNSTDWDVMCDAARDMGNDIKMCCITYVHGETYREYCICNGPDIATFWKEHSDEGVSVITATNELNLIQLIFMCIKKFDPDIIIGHNIAGFDIPYIIGRNRLLTMLSGKAAVIPNISRLKDQVIKPYPIEWNNSQVSMSGKLLNVPGRIWIDTLILAARSFLGQMENAKLDTLAKVHLGMSKNDVGHKDMFAWFSLWNRMNEGEISQSLDNDIDSQYEIGLLKYNKTLPCRPNSITVDHVNILITMINVMNQRGTRISLISKREGMNMDLNSIYDYAEWECQLFIERWNVERVESKQDKVNTLWWIVGRYCVHDTRIPYRVINLLDVVTVLMEQSNIFSVPINDILCRGQMHAVQTSQYKYAKKMSFLVDLVDKGDPSGVGQMGGGYVGKGKPGLKIKDDDSIVMVVDFASLYPTIIIAYNICYTTWVPYANRGVDITEDMCNIIYVDDLIDKDTKQPIPRRTHWFLKKEILAGIVPTMLDEQRLSRKSIKRKMNTTKDPIMKGVYSAQEKAIKVGMNSSYGAFGTEHSYICCRAASDATTAIGRGAIHKCNEEIEKEGLEVVYNDTDSAMILVDQIRKRFITEEDKDKDESSILVSKIKNFGNGLASRLSTYFPDPMALECENIFLSFFLKGPKMYTSIKWNEKDIDLASYGMKYIEANNLLYVKGLASVRRDKYNLYKIIYNKFLELILTKHDASMIVNLMEKYIMAIWTAGNGYKNIKKLEEMFSYNMGVSAKALGSSTATMGKWVSEYEKANKRKPIKGERFKLLVCEGSDPNKHTKSADKLFTADWMIKEGKKLDIEHYLNCWSSDGGIIELLNIAYGEDAIPRKCMKNWYIKKLKEDGNLD